MRILAIRGKNIASLADLFIIDLEAEPLASTGLFAITGETGAGKSTLLDALCLALYGNCPRLSAEGSQEKIPEMAGGEIQSTDSRSCLRRGAAEGWAEVDFVGVDDVRYRASWQARRARGRADGALQNVTRTLKHLDDDTVVESGIRDVNAAVERTTGLTYDQFRRTVLLAQGDFDAFLRADNNARADLLEKITGTSIYREISRRVFERHTGAVRIIETLDTRRREHSVISDEEQAALIESEARLEREIVAHAARRTELDGLIARHAAIDAAEAHVRDAEAQLAASQAHLKTLTAERTRLARLDMTEPLRAPLERVTDRRGAIERAEKELSAAHNRLNEAKLRAATTGEAAKLTEQALKAVEARFKSLGPTWTLATQLDTEVQGAAVEVAEATRKRDEASEKSLKAARLSQALGETFEAQTAEHTRATSELEDLASLQPLADRWDEIDSKLAKRESFRTEFLDATRLIANQRSAVAEHQTELATLEDTKAEDRRTRDSIEAQISKHKESLEILSEIEKEQRNVKLGELREILLAIGQIANDYVTAASDIAATAESKKKIQVELDRALQDEAASRASHTEAQAVVNALSVPLRRAEEAVSEYAAHLRARLTPGEPCPVCGSKEHPVLADEKLAVIAASLRADVKIAQEHLGEAGIQIVDAQARKAGAQAGITEADGSSERLKTRLQSTATDYENALDKMQTKAAELALAIVLPESPVKAAGLIVAASALVANEREAVFAALRSARSLRDQIGQLTGHHTDLMNAIEQRAAKMIEIRARLSAAREILVVEEQKLNTSFERLTSIDHELAPWIGAAGLGPVDLDDDMSAARTQLLNRSQTWSSASCRVIELNALLQRMDGELAQARGQAEAAASALDMAERDLVFRIQKHAEKQAARVAVLEGEPTEAHRSRFNAERIATQEANVKEAAQAALAASELAAAHAASTAAERQRDIQLKEYEAAKVTLEAALAKSGLDHDDLANLLTIEPHDIAALRLRVDEADRTMLQIEAALTERRKDLAEALTAGHPESGKAQLEASRTALDVQQADCQSELGAIRSQLQADSTARAAVAQLDQEIATAKGVANVWAAVNAAVGSRNGDRFQRFAQGVTLDLLVELANGYLRALKPRYRLVRAANQELGLHVVDTDMGDDVRSTRSLSGGERFLVSLALALALSGIEGRQNFVDTLFIDEGFGSLDSASLEIAIDALETLQSHGRTVGVISHVDAMKDRIPVQVQVVRQGSGRSTVVIAVPEGWAA